MAEYKDRLPTTVVDNINAAVSDLRGVMESENPEVGCLFCRTFRGSTGDVACCLLLWRAGVQTIPVHLLSHGLDMQEIKAKINALQQAMMKIGESLAGSGGAGGEGGSGENVQDAEVKDKKE